MAENLADVFEAQNPPLGAGTLPSDSRPVVIEDATKAEKTD